MNVAWLAVVGKHLLIDQQAKICLISCFSSKLSIKNVLLYRFVLACFSILTNVLLQTKALGLFFYSWALDERLLLDYYQIIFNGTDVPKRLTAADLMRCIIFKYFYIFINLLIRKNYDDKRSTGGARIDFHFNPNKQNPTEFIKSIFCII